MGAVELIGPGERVDYSVDWSDWLVEGDEVASAAWTVEPAGPLLEPATDIYGLPFCWVSGCARGVVYRLTCALTTTAEREAERSIVLRCEDR